MRYCGTDVAYAPTRVVPIWLTMLRGYCGTDLANAPTTRAICASPNRTCSVILADYVPSGSALVEARLSIGIRCTDLDSCGEGLAVARLNGRDTRCTPQRPSCTVLAYASTACYALPGTDLAYAATTNAGNDTEHNLAYYHTIWRYAMSGTDLAFAGTNDATDQTLSRNSPTAPGYPRP
eukprot:2680395-Rhodomonas_salina.1